MEPPEHRANIIPVENETKSSSTRITSDGRTLTYQMTVLQQPVRARACGQGAKSSADRRPVDPPPIVELQIFQGEKREEDITFTMNANYFLFATLEQARPMAHGRMPQERSTPPVLTGTPVAGMVYLDRPKPAGYFIFPDLSVRHEGKYRLSFSLYEELKHSKDDDKVEEGASPNTAGDAHVTHRLEVKSEPFHVFSAKKFPGLTESTSLSRMVAEQGCRVRIRRDVRMRRRDHKGGSKDWDDYEDETAAQRARASATPDPHLYQQPIHPPHAYMDPVARPRSASNASHHSSLSRRTSAQDLSQGYSASQYGTAPQTPQNGSYPQTSPYTSTQAQQYQQPAPFVQQQQPMQPPPPQFHPQQAYPAPPPPMSAPSAQTYYACGPGSTAPQPSQPQYSTQSHTYDSALQQQQQQQQRSSVEYSPQIAADYRRTSAHIPPPPPPAAAYSQPARYQPPASQTYQQSSQQSYSSIDPYSSLPSPLEPVHLSSAANTLPPLNTAMMPAQKLEASSPMSTGPQNSYFSNELSFHDKHKRSFGKVFSNRHQNEPLRQGARPSSTYGHGDSFASAIALSAADDDDNTSGDLDPETLGMQYRRADGRQIRRALPGHG